MNAIRKPLAEDYVRLLLVSAIWGATFISIEIALADYSPLAIACWRVILAATALYLFCRHLKLTVPSDFPTLALLGVIGVLNSVVPFTLIGWGQQTVNSAVAALLLATTPFMSLILSHLMTRDDRFSLNRLLGVIVGFGGVVLLFLHELVFVGNNLVSMLAILLAAFCYSASSLMIRRLAHLPSLVVATGATLIVAIIVLPILLWHAPPWQQTASSSSLLALIFLAAGPTAVAQALRTKIVQTNGAVFVANCGYLIPVFATLWAWLFFDQWPSLVICIAIVMIFVGIVIGQRKRIGTS